MTRNLRSAPSAPLWRSWLLWVFLLQASWGQDGAPEIPSGAALLKADLLAVLAHPDDETMMASTVAYYARVREKRVAHVYCTRGEGGGNMVGTQWGEALGILREAELKRCLETLGIDHCFFLDQLDWAYTESAAMTLEKWDREAAVEKLTRYIRAMRPEVVLTMSPFPRSGWHGHHQAAGMLAVEATEAAADPARYPGQLSREGLAAWRVPKVYYRGSSDRATVASIAARAVLPDGRALQQVVGEALSNHRSQGFGRFSRVDALRPPETFVLLRSAIETPPSEDDLFSGLSVGNDEGEGDDSERHANGAWMAPKASASRPPLWFTPRPAATNFLRWAEANRVQHLAGDLTSDVPVAAGQSATLELHFERSGAATGAVELAFATSNESGNPPASIALPAGTGSTAVNVPVAVPSSVRADFDLKATARAGGDILATASVTLHPVPVSVSKPVSAASAASALDAGKPLSSGDPFEGAVGIAIPHTNLVQGKADSDADCSAVVRVAHTAEALLVEVEVRDDRLVSNIAPNDIRGHWRSDSVEICLDPAGGRSEHTLTCFKLGVFPRDTAGNVRAARDADANQGPVEETSPGTRIFSVESAGGYVIRAAIPWSEAGIDYDKTAVIGFNVIVYDGDKPDATPGENINEARIAWAPRSGVQGRPEDWGRLILSR